MDNKNLKKQINDPQREYAVAVIKAIKEFSKKVDEMNKNPSAKVLEELNQKLSNVALTVKGDDGYTPVKGKDYDDGKDGISVENASMNSKGELVISLSNGKSVNVGKVRGEDGLDGDDASIDEEALLQRIISKLPKPDKFDEEAFIKRIKKELPEPEKSEKIIQKIKDRKELSYKDLKDLPNIPELIQKYTQHLEGQQVRALGGPTALSRLTDVDLSAVQNGYTLVYNSARGMFETGPGSSGGGDLAATLALGNTTGGNNIVMSANDLIESPNGQSQLILDDGYISILTDGGGYATPYITMDATKVSLAGLSNGGVDLFAASLDISHNTLIKFNTAPVRFNALTASTVPYLDANKDLVSSSVTPTELGYLSGVSSGLQSQLNAKQATLVSGTNIKTINGSSILGSGDLVVSAGAVAFTDLTDVPSSYSGQSLKYVRVNAGETALEFAAIGGGGDMLASTYDPANIAEQLVGLTAAQALTNKDLTGAGNTFPTFNQNTTGSAATLTNTRTLWGQNFNGSANVSGSLTAVGDITGGASSMIIQAGTGASRTLTLKTTNGSSVAQTNLTLNADLSSTFGGTVALGANNLTMTGSIGATGARVTKGWFTDLEVTNTIVGSINGNAATATALQNARTIGGVSFDGTANITVATATGGFTVSGGNLALGTNSITMSGSIGVTGTRVTKGWFTDLEVTNAIVGSVTGSAATLTNARTIGGVSFNGSANITVASATGGFTVSGGDLAIGANNLTITGSIGSTGSRVLKGWFTDLQVTNAIAGSVTGSAASFTGSLSGDVGGTQSATAIGANKVTLGMLATLAANSVIGNSTGSSATPTAVSMLTTATASSIALRDSNANLLANNWLGGYTTTVTAAGTTTLTVGSTYAQFFTGSTTQTVTLPVASTLSLGHQFLVVNNSTGAVTINSSGGNAVIILAGGTSAIITCILTSGTSAASWSAAYFGTSTASGKLFTSSNTLTLAGTDGSTLNIGTGGTLGTAAYTASSAYQPIDSDLTTIAGLTATTDNFIQSKGSAWASRTPTQVTADLIAFVGDSGSGGTKGLVPAPASGDAAAGKVLKADGTWGTVSAPSTFTYTAQTGTYAILTSDQVVDCTSGTFTATLPTAVGVTGKWYKIKNSGTGVITIATTSSQTIDGSTTLLLTQQYSSIDVISDGANWKII